MPLASEAQARMPVSRARMVPRCVMATPAVFEPPSRPWTPLAKGALIRTPAPIVISTVVSLLATALDAV